MLDRGNEEVDKQAEGTKGPRSRQEGGNQIALPFPLTRLDEITELGKCTQK